MTTIKFIITIADSNIEGNSEIVLPHINYDDENECNYS